MPTLIFPQEPIRVEAPEGATHYCGWPEDGPDEDGRVDARWYKFIVNSTGVIRTWCVWVEARKEWGIYGERPPHFLKEIKPENLA